MAPKAIIHADRQKAYAERMKLKKELREEILLEIKQKKVSQNEGESINLVSTSTSGTAAVQCWFESGSSSAVQQENHGQYKNDIHMASKTPFSLVEYTIKEGPFKGCSALVVDPPREKSFRFLDLPAELRNMVYNCLLTTTDQILIQGTTSKMEFYKSWWPSNTAMLSVDKQTSYEALHVLYGTNRFEFYCTTSLQAFLELIGTTNMRYMRNVTVLQCYKTSAKRAATMLKKHDSLAEFKMSFCARSNLSRRYNARTVTDAFKPLIKSLWKQHRDMERVFRIFTVGVFNGHPCYYARSATACSHRPDSQAACDSFLAEMKRVALDYV